MLRLQTFLLGLLFSFVLLAQDSASVVSQAHEYVNVLAGPEMFGRGYVSKGDALAAEYLAERFKALGAKPIHETYYQTFEFPVNTFPYPMSVLLDSVELLPGDTYLLDPASGSATGSFEVVEVPMHDLEQQVVAIVADPCRECSYWVQVPETSNRDSLMLFYSMRSALAEIAPVVWVNNGKFTWGAAREAYKFPLVEVKYSKEEPPTVVHLRIRNYLQSRHEARNVIAMIPAAKKSKEYVFFTAHYDHLGMMGPDAIFTGANDNASGTSMLLTLAEHYAKNPADVNIVFIAFAAEEAGLLGSHFFVEHPTVDLTKIRFVINLDIFGTGDEGITVVNATEHEKEFMLLKKIGEQSGRLAKVKKRGPTQNSDHYPFTTKDVPAFFIYTMGGIKAYHDIYDRPETLPLTKYYDIYLTLTEFVESLE